MNRYIDSSIEQSVFQFFSEDTFASNHSQRIGFDVTSCLDDFNANFKVRIKLRSAAFACSDWKRASFDPREPITRDWFILPARKCLLMPAPYLNR